jgi:hypothetical protein
VVAGRCGDVFVAFISRRKKPRVARWTAWARPRWLGEAGRVGQKGEGGPVREREGGQPGEGGALAKGEGRGRDGGMKSEK